MAARPAGRAATSAGPGSPARSDVLSDLRSDMGRRFDRLESFMARLEQSLAERLPPPQLLSSPKAPNVPPVPNYECMSEADHEAGRFPDIYLEMEMDKNNSEPPLKEDVRLDNGVEKAADAPETSPSNGLGHAIFAQMDVNGDGTIDANELEAAIQNGLFSQFTSSTKKNGSDAFVMRDEWEASTMTANERLSGGVGLDNDEAEDEEDKLGDGHVHEASCFFMLHPTCSKRLWWDFFSVLWIVYDMVWIPIELGFSPEKNSFTDVMFHGGLLFWTIDVPLTFITGSIKGLDTEMRISRTAVLYIRSWFIFDVLIVSADWMAVLVANQSRMLAMGRIVRTLRVLRTLRLLRLVKMSKMLEILIDNVTSEYMHVVINMVKIMVMVLMLNHTVACSWYHIGTSSDNPSWPTRGHFAERDTTLYRYLTSMHWSLTQFTPASMEVFPTNESERAFAVCTLIFALLVFSSFVSSITASMTQLRNMMPIYDKNTSLLRRYLKAKNTPLSLYIKVIKHVQHQQAMRKQQIQESDVVCLKLLSRPLYEELIHTFVMPTLGAYEVFNKYLRVSSAAMRSVSNTCVVKLSLCSGDRVFLAGSRDDRMLFMENGKLRYNLSASRYTQAPKDGLTDFLETGDWCCEGSLWLKWTHVGTMHASEFSNIIAIDGNKFAEVTKGNILVRKPCSQYATKFLESLNQQYKSGNLSDLRTLESLDTETVADEVFDEALDEIHEESKRFRTSKTSEFKPSMEGAQRMMFNLARQIQEEKAKVSGRVMKALPLGGSGSERGPGRR